MANISRRSDVDRMVQDAIAAFGRIDILVCNAGITRFARFFETTEEDWGAVVAVDVKGTYLRG